MTTTFEISLCPRQGAARAPVSIRMPLKKEHVELVAACLTPMIALITVWIAFQQWRINHLKVKHDLYERRLAVYLALMEFLAAIGQEARASDAQSRVFLQKTRESWFLFGDKIGDYLQAIHNKSVDLRYQNTMLDDPTSGLPVGAERTKLAREHSETLKWFNAQFDTARKKFSRYMKLA